MSDETICRAREIIQSSIDSHESWAAYRRRQGRDNPEYGDLEHHETCLREYAEVLSILAALEAENKRLRAEVNAARRLDDEIRRYANTHTLATVLTLAVDEYRQVREAVEAAKEIDRA